jgi:hypothetical protein
MNSILKYPIEISKTQTVIFPKDTRFLTVQMWRGDLHLWVDIDNNKPLTSYIIEIHGVEDGFDKKKKRSFIDSFEIGKFTFRVYVREDDNANVQ